MILEFGATRPCLDSREGTFADVVLGRASPDSAVTTAFLPKPHTLEFT